MKHNSLRQSSYAVLAALIWGTAFVAQSMAAGAVPSFAFNASRAVIAFVFLLVLCVVLRAVRRRQGKPVSTTRSKKDLLLGGLCCGVAMGPCHLSSAKGLGEHYLRQGELYYHALHCADTHCRPFYEKAGAPHHLAQRGAGGGGIVLPVRYGELYHFLRRSLRAAVRPCVHGTDSLCGPFCKICGRSGALLAPSFSL